MPEFVPPMLATLADRPFSDPRLALRAEAGRLPHRGRRPRRQRPPVDAQQAGRRALFPAPGRRQAGVDQRDRRRSWTARSWPLERTASRASRCCRTWPGMKGFGAARGERAARGGRGGSTSPAVRPPPSRRARSSTTSSTCSTTRARRWSTCRSRSASSCCAASSATSPGAATSPTSTEDGEDFHEAAGGPGARGHRRQAARALATSPGSRSRSWLKIKIRREQELVVIGYEPGKGTHKDLGALLVAVHEDGQLRYAGEVGSGIDTRQRAAFRSRAGRTGRATTTCGRVPRIGRAGALGRTKLVIRAEFTEWTSDDLLRQAAFKGLEPDKDWHDVIRERPLHTDEAVDAAAGGRRSGGGQAADRTAPAQGVRPARSGAPWRESTVDQPIRRSRTGGHRRGARRPGCHERATASGGSADTSST